MERRTFLYLMLAVTIVIWGASFVIVDIAIREGSSPSMMAMARFIVASSIFLGYLILRRPPRLAKVDRRKFLFLAFIGIGVYYTFQYYGVKLAGASISSIIVMLVCPVAIFAISAWKYKESVSHVQKLGLAVSGVGCFLVITNGSLAFASNKEVIVGGLLGVVSAVLWAVYTLEGRNVVKKYDPMTSTAYITILGTFMAVPFAAADATMTGQSFPLSFFLAALYLGVLCTVIGYVFWYTALTGLDARTTGSVLYFEPVVTVMVAWAVLGEMIGWVSAVGSFVTLIGVVILSRK
ncbi:MAG: DMT family transporter [Thermoplasmata archaeon]|nr:DMT family transporter [Thermoplasmata archaeon]